MPAEIIEIECPSCGCEFEVPMREFVDAQEDPTVKKKIIEGEFFLNACPDCGDQMLVEYPVMYTDPEKKLNVYLAPGHEEDLLDQMPERLAGQRLKADPGEYIKKAKEYQNKEGIKDRIRTVIRKIYTSI